MPRRGCTNMKVPDRALRMNMTEYTESTFTSQESMGVELHHYDTTLEAVGGKLIILLFTQTPAKIFGSCDYTVITSTEGKD